MTRPPDRRMFGFLAAYDRNVAELVFALREILLEEAPQAVEKAYPNHPAAIWFGFGEKTSDTFCYIAAATKHINLGFCRGASLSDPNHVLEGTGKALRHIKFRNQQDLERPFVRRYIRAAVEKIAS